jgi:DNA invertase Pin-like site-specific DNA recombinase
VATRGALATGDAIYARYSSELQNPRSCDDQITELRQALERRGGRYDERLVFRDAEVSGGIWERDGLQALLAAVESGRVRRVFIEDVSRLSRDKEDAARIEKTFDYHGVSIVTLDGMTYDGSVGASLAFTFQSAGAAQYLRDLGAKTRRGLRGAHRDGKSTGGRCYGYRVANGKLEVEETEAATVRTIFALYLDGHGYAVIAQKLNGRGVPAPRSRRRAGIGWMHSCIREMLRNRKYVGEFTFGVRKWQRHPMTRRRVARTNHDADVLRTIRPELAIVDRPTWDAVQALLTDHAKSYKARAVPHGKTSYLLTGLLRCGCCGAAMQIMGGSTERYYRCVANRKRGTCSNRLSVRERLTRTRILAAVSEALATPKAIAYVRQRIAERAGSLSRDAGRELGVRSARLERTEERIRGLITMQADGDRSPMVAQMRADLESQAAQERAAIADLRAVTSAPIRLPPVDLLTERVLSLRLLSESMDVQSARKALQSYFRGGTITMTPEPHGDGQAYVARGEFMPLALLMDKAATPSEPELGGRCPPWVARGRFEPPTIRSCDCRQFTLHSARAKTSCLACDFFFAPLPVYFPPDDGTFARGSFMRTSPLTTARFRPRSLAR